ncbi:MAG: pilus assembly protein [Burkholderiaceae bacterium]
MSLAAMNISSMLRLFGCRARLRSLALLSLLMGALTCAHAEDIDIYAASPSDIDRPNVLIILDSSANWSAAIGQSCTLADDPSYVPSTQEAGSKMAIEKCALYNVIHALPTKPDGSAYFNVGLMLFNESPASNSGGYVRRALMPVTAANKAAFKQIIRNLDVLNDKGNNAAFTKALHEAFLVFSGGVPYKGTAGTKWDPAAVAGGRYVQPGGATSCARNFIIFIGNGSPGEVTDNEARALLAGAGGDSTKLTYPTAYITNSAQSNWADEYTRFLNGADVSAGSGRQNVVTHAIAVTGASSDGLYPNFMRAMANQGGGSYYAASNASTLTQALTEIFNQIQAVDSVFSAVSLPLSASRQGTYQNQIFVGIFRPDAQSAPRWMGNLKQFQVAYDAATDSLSLVDADGKAAISASTGFINPNARSFWTSASTFWINEPLGTPPTASDSPDGEVAEKGGAAQRLRTTYASNQDGRKVYTCLSCISGTLLSATSFERNNASLTAASLGVTSGDRTALIDWVRGQDNAGDEKGPGSPTSIRPSVHNDVLHSRPVVIDYGGSTGVVVYYGTNGGLLHAVRGQQTGAGAGEELWSFVAEEFFPKLVRQRSNSPLVLYPTTPAGITAARRDYFFDGPIGVYRDSASGRTIIYPTMRRGGRSMYAIDVSDPLQPRFLWKLTDSAASVLGQTWSEPRIARVRGQAGPVIIMGAGYDADAEDVDPPVAGSRGKAVLVIDALTGSVLRQFSGTERSVPADVALLDTDFDGYIDRAYAIDVGGDLYRIDLESALGSTLLPSEWTMNRIARLGDGLGARKFFFGPDVIATKTFTAIMMGSGDREKPLKTSGDDGFYLIKDTRMGKGPPSGTVSPILASELASVGSSSAFEKGCSLPLLTGEKVVTNASTIGGTTFFSTNRPTASAPGSCSANLGEAKAYELPLFCRPARFQVLVGGGLPPSPVVGVIELSTTPPGASAPVSKVVPFVIGGISSRQSALEIKKVTPPIPVKRRRPYWYTETDR